MSFTSSSFFLFYNPWLWEEYIVKLFIESKIGCLIFPYDKEELNQDVRNRILANDTQSPENHTKIIELGVRIPQSETSFDSFCNQIRKSEEAMTTQLY